MRRGLLTVPVALLVLPLAWGCAPRRIASPLSATHYSVGEPYRTAGIWLYPREQFRLDVTGLADIVDPAGTAADGEAWDPDGLIAAHGTLQLPCIVRVTNLETGLQIQLRVIDRGPPGVHRLLGVSRHAGALLGMTGAARIRLEVMDGPSQALRDQLHGTPALVARVPVVAVSAETLPPPGSTAAPRPILRTPEPEPPATDAPAALPDTAERVMASPGQLWIDAGDFGQPAAAHIVATRLADVAARAETTGTGRAQRYRVRAGPYPDVPSADSALDRALRAGVTDARIVVE